MAGLSTRCVALCALLMLVAALVHGVAGKMSVDPASQMFIDEQGRVRIFHGVNAVYKIDPWYPQLDGFNTNVSLSVQDAELLASWGFNVVRLGVMWHPVEPTEGQYNTTYLAVMRKLSDMLGQHGIYTLVDSHEDVLSRQFCGEGFPDWAIHVNVSRTSGLTKFPAPLYGVNLGGNGIYPNLTLCQEHKFFEYMFSFEANDAWQNLYSLPELRSAFAGYWNAIATAFDSSDTVLGYELLNEPWPADLYKHPLWMLDPAEGLKNNLMPLYTQAYDQIRKADSDTIVFYEPAVSTSYLNQDFGITVGPGGASDNHKQAVGYHVYCENQNASGVVTNDGSCESHFQKAYAQAMTSVKKAGGGSMLTEFGALSGAPSDAGVLSVMADTADQYLQSWAYWTYKGFHDITTQNAASESLFDTDGSVQEYKLAALSRTYATAIAGMPGTIAMHFDSKTRQFSLTYDVNTKATGPTEIYLNEKLHYPSGFNATATPAGALKIAHTSTNHLEVTLADPSVSGPVQVSILAL